MKKEILDPKKRAATGAYSAAVLVDGWVYVSGQGPLDLATGAIVGTTIEEQTRLTLQHVQRILRAAGCTMADVVRCGCHLADIDDFDRFNATYAGFFAGVLPARTTVESGLGDGMKVEIDCVARVPRRRVVRSARRRR